jgi:hypothetical protein
MWPFTKKTELEVSDGRGGVKKVKVSEQEFNKWVEKGQAVRVCKVHLIGPDGPPRTETWTVGKDIPQEQYDFVKEIPSGDVYIAYAYEAGEPKYTALQKAKWEVFKKAMGY